jgi:phenol/toluene 2-monooxygenase (NADH) P3/A3
MKYHFCSDGCKDIFENEPEKYVQSWLPVHQIFQGNCGGEGLDNVLKYYNLVPGQDNGEYMGSQDQMNWEQWTGRDHKDAPAA